MIEFEVKDMSCGHCAAVIRQTVRAIDAGAEVDVDLDRRRVRIDSRREAAVFAEALTEAGYPPSA